MAVWAYGVRAAVTGHWAERWGGGRLGSEMAAVTSMVAWVAAV